MDDSDAPWGRRLLRTFVTVCAVAFAGAVIWDIPVGTTEAGNKVIVGDYIQALLPSTTDATTADGSGGESAKGQDRITERLYSFLQPGVTTYAVMAGLFQPEDEVSVSNVGGISTRGYKILNSDGSSAFLIFQNGILVSKSEQGL